MKIGVVGSGNMGRTLGGAWADAGHDVLFGSRDGDRSQAVAAVIGRGARSGQNAEAVHFGEVVFYTVRRLPSEFLPSLAGKIVIDCTNRPPSDGLSFPPPLFPSFAERLSADAPDARVVKALNTMAQEVFDQPAGVLREYDVACFMVGDDPDAKQVVSKLVADLGLEAVDCGPLTHAWMVEAAGDMIRCVILGQQRWTATYRIVDPPVSMPRFGGRNDADYTT